MTDVMQEFKHLDSLDETKLLLRQDELKSSVPTDSSGAPNWNSASDAVLQELLAIGRVLRRRTVASPGKTTAKKTPVSLDSL